MDGFFSFFNRLFLKKTGAKSLENLSGLSKVDALFHNLVTEGKVPGMSVTLLKNGETILQKGYGFSNLEEKEPIDPKATLFRIASISKCITGLALGKAVEDGLLDWEAPFHKYVPYYPKKEYSFTIRQLASHTAGIRGYRGKEFALNQSYSIKEGMEIFKNDPLLFEPGQGYLYNSFDFVLLSLTIQEASGLPFEDYVKEKILVPLGMMDTMPPTKKESLYGTDHEITIAEFYSKTSTGFKKTVEVDNFYKLAGGGYVSTSWDIAKMGQAILEGALLDPKTYQQLLAAQQVKGQSVYYGLGFQVSQDIKGRPFVGHVGNSVGAYTNFFVYPQEKAVISILINCTDPKVQEELDRAIQEKLEDNLIS